MIRGKIYKDIKYNSVVMCTKIDASKYFEGVVLSSTQLDLVGLHSKLFVKEQFVEYIGQLDINNAFLNK